MKVVRKFDVSDVSLVSSTIPALADGYALHDPLIAYSTIGTRVQVDVISKAVTITNSVATSAPAYVPWPAHYFSDGDIAYLTGTMAGGWTLSTAYYIVDSDLDGFYLSPKRADVPHSSTAVCTCTVNVQHHKIYRSTAVIAANAGGNPLPHADPAHWAIVGYTNRWRMFDDKFGSQSSAQDSMTVVVQAKGRITSIAILNASCAAMTITCRSAGAVVYGPTTYNMSHNPALTYGMWSYLFEPRRRRKNFVDTDLPPYPDMEITITLSDPGQTVRLGCLIFGRHLTFGGTKFGFTLGATNYSIRQKDTDGNYFLKKGDYASHDTFQVEVPRVMVDALIDFLNSTSAEVVLFIGSDNYDASMVYGIPVQWSMVVDLPQRAILSIELDGFI